MVIFQYNLYILGSIFEPCYIQNHVITNHVIKRFRCNMYCRLYIPTCHGRQLQGDWKPPPPGEHAVLMPCLTRGTPGSSAPVWEYSQHPWIQGVGVHWTETAIGLAKTCKDLLDLSLAIPENTYSQLLSICENLCVFDVLSGIVK